MVANQKKNTSVTQKEILGEKNMNHSCRKNRADENELEQVVGGN